MNKENYRIYVNGWYYTSAIRLDEAIEKARAIHELRNETTAIYEIATAKTYYICE